MNILVSLAFLLSVGAIVYAYRAYRLVRMVFSVMESKKCRVVTVDHKDGKVTIVKEWEPPLE